MNPPELLDGIPVPTPAAVLASRKRAKLSGIAAARLMNLGTPARWYEYERGERNIDPIRWAAWLLAVDQHPALRLARRRAGAAGQPDGDGAERA